MKDITEINWHIFKSKFNEKEQTAFERLCYYLFCNEFNLSKKGIFRYKNQIGIEAEPIKFEGQLIGYQAKFYEGLIRDHTNDIKDSILKAKEKNQVLNKIIFYLNLEFSESRKKTQKDPEYKLEIEAYAKQLAIEIEWRTKSHFEAQLILEENKAIAQHFFSMNKSVIDFIDELTQHTESVLKPIHESLKFKDQDIRLDRTEIIENFKTAIKESPIVIISGKGGTGKTALIKNIYNQIKEKIPFFIFKATEFNVASINEIFNRYGKFTLLDFLKENQKYDEKYIVIDSAEKLSDLKYQEVFQEFLSSLIDCNWKIIFTTRHSYLDDLKFQFVEIYRLNFKSLDVNELSNEELIKLSKNFKFRLPKNKRLLELLRIPFYLNEYLNNIESIKNDTGLSDFKKILWSKRILKSIHTKNIHTRREQCFLKIAKKRASYGVFFIETDDYDNEALQELAFDEVIAYDSNLGKYFITYDIYEEWALEKIIEGSFYTTQSYESFFKDIGDSLPIRRAFRNWLSDKLLISKKEVKTLIENTIDDNKIEAYWKDEVLITILLSEYTEVFFQVFEHKLIEDNNNLLIKVIFLLRIACKVIDENFLNSIATKKLNQDLLSTIFIKPKGSGWKYVINFINKHKENIIAQNIDIILWLLDDWNNNNKKGETTKNASQISLYIYEQIFKHKDFRFSCRDEQTKQLTRIILNGASEIKQELTDIIDKVVCNKEISHTSTYYELVQAILATGISSYEVAKSIPEQVIRLANLFWFKEKNKTDLRYNSGIAIEPYFSISTSNFDYNPASAFQTPIFPLLKFSLIPTVNFILSFTNRTVESYAKSNLDGPAKEIEIFIDNCQPVKQYISNRIWNMYRGTQISTHLLESIHMALEKWLLEYAKIASKTDLEALCLYLIKNSTSASITAVVTSLVLAQRSKLFNIAKILFKTKELFYYETNRYALEQIAKEGYLMDYGINYRDKIYNDERINTCKDAHRKYSLKHLMLQYQFFRKETESEDEFKERQIAIWSILDEYYKKLTENPVESAADKTWRLYLAKMDSRKMKITTESQDNDIIINFVPEIDPELKNYSDNALQNTADKMKYAALNMWARYRLENKKSNYEYYQQYETNIQLAINETKEIIDGLKNKVNEEFLLFNCSTPSYVCSVILRDFSDNISEEDKTFCKDIIIEYASAPLMNEDYMYQISDGTEPAINVLPMLIKHFSKDKNDFKLLILLLIFNPWKQISSCSIRSVLLNLWDIDFDDAHSIFIGYLFLKEKYDAYNESIRKYKHKKKLNFNSKSEILDQFTKNNEHLLRKIFLHEITLKRLDNIKELNIETLVTAFELLPFKTQNQEHKEFLEIIFSILSQKISLDRKEFNYELKARFLKKLSYFILSSEKDEIKNYLKSFIHNLNNSSSMIDFFKNFISAEDDLNSYDNFWLVWETFYEKIITICKKDTNSHYDKYVIYAYFLASMPWKSDAKEWHTLREREKVFFSKVINDIGDHPSVLFSITRLLDGIGSIFIEDGINWLNDILSKNKEFMFEEIETDTIYYIENLMRRYILTNRHKIKVSAQLKNKIILILNFLVKKGSATGYLLREDIL